MGCVRWLWMALLLLAAVIPLGCDSADEQASTQITKTVGNVESGYAFDWAKGDLHGLKKIVVPATADVRPDAQGTEFIAYLQETLDYSGQSAQPMSIRTLRRRMGVAGRMEQDALVLATYGEWDAGAAGGATIKLVLLVPPDVEVSRRSELSGKGSPANGEDSILRSGPPDPTATATAQGWMPLDETYDPQRRVLQ